MDNNKKYVINKLREYGIIDREIAGIKFKIGIINDRMTKIRTSKLGESAGNNCEYMLEKLMDDKVNLETNLQYKYLQRDNINEALKLLNKEEEELLKGIYCNRKSMTEICNRLQYSRSQIHRKREKALEKLSKLVI